MRDKISYIDRDNITIDINGQHVIIRKPYGLNKLKPGLYVNVLFRPDDIIISSCNKGPRVLRCRLLDYKITKCNVKLYLEIATGTEILAEISRGYIYNILGRMEKGQQICLELPIVYISTIGRDIV